MKDSEFYITYDNLRIHAKLDFPAELLSEKEDDRTCPLVIVVHGFTGHMEETHIVGVARTLNETGYATLRVEMYGHGKSDGEFKDHTLLKWMTQMMAVIDYAKALPFVTDLYLCGHSQGGLLTILAAGMKHEVFKAIIPLAPATMIPEGARNGELLGQTFDPENIPDLLTREEGLVLDGNYVRAAQMVYVEPAIRRYRGPVLIVHADTDEAVPYQCALDAVKLYENAKLVTIPGDTHCYDHHLDQVLDAVKAFMEEMKA